MLKLTIVVRQTRSNLVNVIRTATNSTQMNIEVQMKTLNDRKDFAKAISLFDKYKHQHMPTDRAVVQALKACAQLRDVKYGMNIHKNLSNHSLNDSYIQSTLIYFYSKPISS